MRVDRRQVRGAGVAAVWASTVLMLVAAECLAPLADVSGGLRVVVSGVMVLAMAAPATVGAVVVLRRPGTAIGWLLLVMAPAWALALLDSAAVKHLVHTGDALPAQQALTWLEGWSGFVAFNALAPLLLLVFPTGRLPSPRWRPAAWLVVVGAVLGVVGGAFQPGGLPDFPTVDNPLGVGGAAGRLMALLYGLSWVCFAGAAVLALAALVTRLLRAGEVERQQVKWVMYAAGLFAVVFPTWLLSPDVLGPVVTVCAFGAIPVAVGVAVLRYRLYDIDRVISRTLSYTLLTGLLVGVYLAVVSLLTAVLPLSSAVSVAAATLTASAVFEPARRRLQVVIDRRFNRARYDAGRLVEGFAGRLRESVDLDRVEEQLLGTARLALQPTTVSFWPTSRADAR